MPDVSALMKLATILPDRYTLPVAHILLFPYDLPRIYECTRKLKSVYCQRCGMTAPGTFVCFPNVVDTTYYYDGRQRIHLCVNVPECMERAIKSDEKAQREIRRKCEVIERHITWPK